MVAPVWNDNTYGWNYLQWNIRHHSFKTIPVSFFHVDWYDHYFLATIGGHIKMEYFLKFWGGAEPYISSILGITDRNFWFDTKEERDEFKTRLRPYHKYGLAFSEREGDLTHARTVALVTVKYRNRKYFFEFDFGYEYPEENACYMFFDGDYSCDCNLSLFIQQEGGHPEFPELGCGDEIQIVNFDIEYRK
jgi:hypothetical protein